MSTQKLFVLSIPTILVTLFFGIFPWGFVAALISVVLLGIVIFLPKGSLVKANSSAALEGLTHGDVGGAKEHIQIALREAEGLTELSLEEAAVLRNTCDRVAAALIESGEIDSGNVLRKRGEAVLMRLGKREK